MPLVDLDHAALPTDQPEQMIAFYKALGVEVVHEEAWRQGKTPVFAFALRDSKINVHPPELWRNPEFTLRGPTAAPGCGDFCFVWDGSMEDVVATLEQADAPIVEGPVSRQGGRARGRASGSSVYTRDPDGNLLEFIVYE